MGKFAVLVQRSGKRFRAVTAAGKTGFTAGQVAKLQKFLARRPGRIVAATPIKTPATMTEFLDWAVKNEPAIHYPAGDKRTQSVPVGESLPQTVDCSQFYTWACRVSGYADPNKLNYGGDPYTGTLLSGMQLVAEKDARPDDAVVFGDGTGEHVAAVYKVDATGITLCSHGQEKGPLFISLNEEAAAHSGAVRFLRPTTLA